MSQAKKLSDFPVLESPPAEAFVPAVHLGKNWRVPFAGIKKGLGLNKGDVGLDKVDNTSDAEKPISAATQAALDQKSGVGHQHSYEQIGGLSVELAKKADATHSHQEFAVIAQELSQKSDVSHGHQITHIQGLSDALAARPTSGEVAIEINQAVADKVTGAQLAQATANLVTQQQLAVAVGDPNVTNQVNFANATW